MRKIITCGVALLSAAAPAVATAKPDKKAKPGPYSCIPKNVGYKASGTLVESSLTQTAGADTAKRGDDRYSGDLTVDVKKANPRGLRPPTPALRGGSPPSDKGEQEFTVTNARVKFHPRNDSDVAAGDRVKVSGKITKLRKKCDDNGFEPTVTVRKVDFKAAKAAKS